ncbi:hypothetical protein ncot_11780 [Nocardioides sp. JQ2195]|uniref:hypothetical protein n=1 Tax=Nocardioides sp. JQ2195 TaxID=2592334 RepID=UPI00143E9D72|nr:hypothetical protein [Nocardioides sp. JQ2195]QIX27203.1 hypothetical protein ncot_11780 [Nocardioides sp. JQ2195]
MTDARESCALKLEELAADPRFEGRHEDLQSLATAVRDQGDGSWTGVDLIGAFPAEASITVRGMHSFERVAGAIAGISVFLPVAWTWWSLHSASKAYEDLLNAGDEKGRTFLAMWTTGFDGRLTGNHQLVPMAMISFSLVLAAVACIVVHRLVAERNVGHEENSAREARRDLAGALGAAQRFLNERRTDDPRFLEAALKRSVKELNKAHEASRKGVEELRKATNQAVEALNSSTNQALSALNSSAEKSFESLNTTTGKSLQALTSTTNDSLQTLGATTSKAVEDLGAVSNQLAERLQPLLDASSRAGAELASSAAAATTAQEQLSSSTTHIQQALTGALDEFKSSVAQSNSQLAKNNSQVSQQTISVLQQFTEGLGRVAGAKDEWAHALTSGLDANRQSVDDVRAGNVEFASLLQQHQGTLQAQINDLTLATDLASQLLNELRLQGEADASRPSSPVDPYLDPAPSNQVGH